MNILDKLAERHIQEAITRGELDDLPGSGQPLQLDDDSLIAPELRAAYRLLKNSGFLPPELSLYSEIRDIEALLGQIDNAAERSRAVIRLNLLRAQLGGKRSSPLAACADYQHKLMQKLNT